MNQAQAILVELPIIFCVSALSILKIVDALGVLQRKDYLWQRMNADKSVRKIKPQDNVLIFPIFIEFVKLASASIMTMQGLIIINSIETLILGTLTAYYAYRFVRKSLSIPVFTVRIMVNLLFIFGILCALIILTSTPALLLIMSGLLAIPFVVATNSITRIPVFIGHRFALRKARNSLNELKQLKRINITGSFGKTSTKLMLQQILSENGKIISTPGSVNTDVGVAVSVNRQLDGLTQAQKKKLDTTVIETDAYLKGTIARVVRFFPSDFALITGINQQHLGILGDSIEDVMSANAEIALGLKDSKHAALGINAESVYAVVLARGIEEGEYGQDYQAYLKTLLFYGIDGESYETKPLLDVAVTKLKEEIKPGSHMLKFDLKLSEKLINYLKEQKLNKHTLPATITGVNLALTGRFSSVNFAGASLMALLAGRDPEDIKSAASKVNLQERTLNLSLAKSEKGDIEIIDDSFNANPNGVQEDLQLIFDRNKLLPATNLIIFSGLYDLGASSAEIHQQLAKFISKLGLRDTTLLFCAPKLWDEFQAGLSKAELAGKGGVKFVGPDKLVEMPKIIEKFINSGHTKSSGAESSRRLKRISAIGKINKNLYERVQSLKST
jgi:UDP-N-acetylmuramoyl-tripeptide--D-alanyl-D-alanine ligase